ncbi:MAG: TPM domain-containing protein [Bacteroidales bacterium]|jgi:uncharacterized protein|nr:TPM domain-containing protein [Bacteroidales bacterium]
MKSSLSKIYCFIAVLAFLFVLMPFRSYGDIPPRPSPSRLVNDLASVFSFSQAAAMERKLDVFSDSTSNQIAVVTVDNLYGMDKARLAYTIGEKWGVGQKKFDNGVVILIKPKTGSSRGEVFIATGYGLESVLTDAVCKRITETILIPHFRRNDYYGGVDAALDIIFRIVSGEISSSEFARSKGGKGSAASVMIIFLFCIFVVLLISGGKNNKNMGGRNGGGKHDDKFGILDAILLGSLLSGRRSGGWGSGGGFGGLGGSSGGFGGFGGGGFGGGGAGGSW